MSRRLLVVDDEKGIRAALTQLLEYEGYEVRAASSGTEGLAIYDQWKPQPLERLEAVHARHLHVEEHELRLPLVVNRESFGAR